MVNGQYLKSLREQQRLSQRDVSRAAGVTQPYISMIESNKVHVRDELAVMIVKAIEKAAQDKAR
jgi:transcriptional regulator with XRE-family HTH domain